MADRIFALVDGNNFYVSCERLWRPSLGRPAGDRAVLSNNDGCAVARSNEAKALGIRMGTPFFEVRHLEEEAGLVALSSNYTLYGDMSDRPRRADGPPDRTAAFGHKQPRVEGRYSEDDQGARIPWVKSSTADGVRSSAYEKPLPSFENPRFAESVGRWNFGSLGAVHERRRSGYPLLVSAVTS